MYSSIELVNKQLIHSVEKHMLQFNTQKYFVKTILNVIYNYISKLKISFVFNFKCLNKYVIEYFEEYNV